MKYLTFQFSRLAKKLHDRCPKESKIFYIFNKPIYYKILVNSNKFPDNANTQDKSDIYFDELHLRRINRNFNITLSSEKSK